MRKKLPEGALSWAMYDWANSAFATTVMAGFFPIFFKDYWSSGSEATDSTFWLGISVSISGLVVAIFAPMLGALADQGHVRKRLLFIFAGMGICSTASLYFVAEGQWLMAIILYVLGSIGFLSGNIFYDSLLIDVSDDSNVDFLSGTGYALGYLGGGTLFFVNVLMVQMPESFGLASKSEAVQWAFLMVAVWWAVFSIPLFRNVREHKEGQALGFFDAAKQGSRQFLQTFREIRRLKVVFLFLAAYWLYIDGVDTIVVMAIDYGRSLGFPVGDLITALLMVQFVGFPFALLFGWLGQKFGTKPFILLAIAVYFGITLFASQLDLEPFMFFGIPISKFYSLAFCIAMVQGGIQSLSRSLYTRLIPKDKAAEFFGFYNMIGKFAAIIGPALVGIVAKTTGDHRISIVSVGVLFVLGFALLWFVDEKEGQRIAEASQAQ